MESGATIITRRIRPACESAPVMAMVVSVFPVPGQPISMRSAAPLLEMFICTTSLADRGAGSWYALPERATPLNSSDRCSACPRPDDERPLRAAGACPAWLPPPRDARVCRKISGKPSRHLGRTASPGAFCGRPKCGSENTAHTIVQHKHGPKWMVLVSFVIVVFCIIFTILNLSLIHI